VLVCFWIWSGVIGPWSKVRVLFIFILFNKMNEDMEIKEIAVIVRFDCFWNFRVFSG
jgi:hypothetical protein